MRLEVALVYIYRYIYIQVYICTYVCIEILLILQQQIYKYKKKNIFY